MISKILLCPHIFQTVPQNESKVHNHAKLSDVTHPREPKGGQHLIPEMDRRLVDEQFDLSCVIDCHQTGGEEREVLLSPLINADTKNPAKRREAETTLSSFCLTEG